MGMDASAHVAFGVHIKSDQYYEFSQRWAHLGDEEEEVDFEYDILPVIEGLPEDASWEEKRAARERCPIELERAGYYDDADWVLRVRGTEQTVYWGEAKVLDVIAMDELTQERVDAAKAYAEKVGLPFENPQWVFWANYG